MICYLFAVVETRSVSGTENVSVVYREAIESTESLGDDTATETGRPDEHSEANAWSKFKGKDDPPWYIHTFCSLSDQI